MEEPKDKERLARILSEDGTPQLLLPRSWEFPGASSKAWLLGLSLTLWVLHSLPIHHLLFFLFLKLARICFRFLQPKSSQDIWAKCESCVCVWEGERSGVGERTDRQQHRQRSRSGMKLGARKAAWPARAGGVRRAALYGQEFDLLCSLLNPKGLVYRRCSINICCLAKGVVSRGQIMQEHVAKSMNFNYIQTASHLNNSQSEKFQEARAWQSQTRGPQLLRPPPASEGPGREFPS